MKIKLLLFVSFCIIFLQPLAGKAQAVNTQDSLALVDLYNSTNGQEWINNANWLTASPVDTWFGVTVYNSRVTILALINNKLSGTLPSSLGNLAELNVLALRQNQLTGSIPSSLGSLPKIYGLDFRYNRLNGTLPSSLRNVPPNTFLQLEHNQFTFDGMEYLANNAYDYPYFPTFNPQADIPLHKNGNVYSVTAGGTLSNNTYRWRRDGILVATKTGDSTYTSALPGNYGVEVSNAVITTGTIPTLSPGISLTLFSTTKANVQDSLSLVDLYNSTNGTGWINNYNWLSQQPLSNWYGVTVRSGGVILLNLSANGLTGSLPASMSNLNGLVSLDLSQNQLTGDIVPISRLRSISSMDLSSNQLSGSLPDSVGTNAQISFLNLSDNMLAGPLPAIIGNPAYTEIMYLSKNRFSGNIPVGIGRLRLLSRFSLRENQLSGSIPDSLGLLSSLEAIDLSNNQLTGSIPNAITNVATLSSIDFSNNRLSGKITDSIKKLTRLTYLLLNGNQLSGIIPTFQTALSPFVVLHIQRNQFNFDGMETLPQVLNLSYTPQAIIPLHRNGNLFSVSAGGTLSNNTYKLYKDGILSDTKTADSSFAVMLPGQYYVTVTNSVATQLTLYTDTIAVSGLRLADSTSGTRQTISGTSPVNVVDTPYQSLVLTVTPIPGGNALSGEVIFKVTIDPAVTSFNNQPYVQRHYDIMPVSNAATAQATVKLYFTQQDFDNFNAAPAHGLDLPTAPTDAAGIANLRVYQYHGFSTTSLPGSYSGNAVEIDPLDANIVWNAAAQYWEVSFEVSGFSGFFVSSLNTGLLPVRLVSFTGNRKSKETLLHWASASEVNTHYFEVQRSTDGNAFTGIGTVRAAGNSAVDINYVFSDITAVAPVYYYRLKMIDIDGRFAYSKVIKLSLAAILPALGIYPNPASDFVMVSLPETTTHVSTLQLTDPAGRMVKIYILPAGVQQARLSLAALPRGMYKMVYRDAGKTAVSTLLIR